MKIEYVAVEELRAYDKNARTHSPDQVAQIVASINEFGFTNPVLIDENNELIAGHGRTMAAQSMGLEKVPAIRLVGLSDQQKKALRIADNQLALNAGWDFELLAQEIQQLDLDGYDLDVLGFDEQYLTHLLDGDVESLMRENGDGSGAGDEADRSEDDDEGLSENYSRKIDAPIYEIKGERPKVVELYDSSKTDALKAEIEAADLPADVRAFLLAAAERHTVFNFAKIAEFYAHADKEVQELMGVPLWSSSTSERRLNTALSS